MKVLVIRFSSFGDVLQTLSVIGRIHESWPNAEIECVTREEFKPLVEGHPGVTRVWTLKRGAGFAEVWRLGGELKRQKYTHIYDAHNNLRSHIIGWRLNGLLGWRRIFNGHKFLRRSIYRIRRFFLFKFRKNFFPQPFSGQFALLEPLVKWGLQVTAPAVPQLFLKAHPSLRGLWPAEWKGFVALAPSAAFPLKRWPLEHWAELIRSGSDYKFILLGGPEDTFLNELVQMDPRRVVNLAGKLTLEESAWVITQADALVANDTGLMHVAEQTGKPCLALMGPAPFGFPSRPTTKIFELNLPCRPCSKHGQGPCVNPEFHKCLKGISPDSVKRALEMVTHA